MCNDGDSHQRSQAHSKHGDAEGNRKHSVGCPVPEQPTAKEKHKEPSVCSSLFGDSLCTPRAPHHHSDYAMAECRAQSFCLVSPDTHEGSRFPPSLPPGFQLTVPLVAMGKLYRVESLEGAPQKLLPFLLSFLFRAERVEAERPRQEKPISQQNTPSQPLGTASQGLQLLAPKALPALPFALSVPHGGALRNSSGASSSTAPHTGSF